MDNLPQDIIIDILSRLPIKALLRCRCVCKSWFNTTFHSRLLDMHFNRASQNLNNKPNLILHTSTYTDATSFLTQLLFVENDETHDYTCVNLNTQLPNFQHFRVMGSSNGLLCMVDHPRNLLLMYVCNPLNGEYFKVPQSISPSHLTHCIVVGFGFEPKTHEYKILAIVYYNGPYGNVQSEVHVYTLGDSSWRVIGNAPYLIIEQSASKAFVNGAFHWVSSCAAKLIVSFHIGDEVFGVISRPEFGLGQGSYSLGMLRGCLSLTDSSFEDRVEIWVMNDYGVSESWTKCFTINCCQVGWNIRYVQTLCFQKNGEVLMLYNNQALLSYHPETKRLRKLCIVGLPCWFEVVAHVGSLVSQSRRFENRHINRGERTVKWEHKRAGTRILKM